MNFFSDCKLSEMEWRFGKESYSRANPPPAASLLLLFLFVCPDFFLSPDQPAVMQCFPGQTATNALAPGHQYLATGAKSDVDDPELGAAAMEEDDATARWR